MFPPLTATPTFMLELTLLAILIVVVMIFIIPRIFSNAAVAAFSDSDLDPDDYTADYGWRLTRWLETTVGIGHAHVPERQLLHEDQAGKIKTRPDGNDYVCVYDTSYLICTECGERLPFTNRTENKRWRRVVDPRDSTAETGTGTDPDDPDDLIPDHQFDITD